MDTYGYEPCQHEDSAGPCYWDASVMGNGYGTSFVVHADQSVEYGPTFLPPTEVLPEPLPLVGIPNTVQPVQPDTLAETGPWDGTGTFLVALALVLVGWKLVLKY